jgi:hypothetical protein
MKRPLTSPDSAHVNDRLVGTTPLCHVGLTIEPAYHNRRSPFEVNNQCFYRKFYADNSVVKETQLCWCFSKL